MHTRDAVFLEDLCPKLRVRRWRQSLHSLTHNTCIYCGRRSESVDHLLPQSRGGPSVTENCVPACLSCNGHKSDADPFEWYRRQRFYDPRRAMAIRAWMDGDLKLAMRLLQWATPQSSAAAPSTAASTRARQSTTPVLPTQPVWQPI
jgi:HNH endonuclease